MHWIRMNIKKKVTATKADQVFDCEIPLGEVEVKSSTYISVPFLIIFTQSTAFLTWNATNSDNTAFVSHWKLVGDVQS
jgi:hypothetical protein